MGPIKLVIHDVVFYVYILVNPLRTKRHVLFRDQPSSYGLGWPDLTTEQVTTQRFYVVPTVLD